MADSNPGIAEAESSSMAQTHAFLLARTQDINWEGQIAQMMGFGRRTSSSSPPVGSNSGQIAISTPHSSPPQRGPSAAGQNSKSVIDAPARELFESQAGTFGLWTGALPEADSPAPEEFYRSAGTYRPVERQAPALSRRPATPMPRRATSRRHPTVPLTRRTVIDYHVPSSIEDPVSFPLAPSLYDHRDFNGGLGQEIERPSVIPRQPTIYPAPAQYATVPISAAERKRLRPIRPHGPRLPADYRAETPFSFQQPVNPLPLMTAPHPNTITLSNKRYNGPRIGGVELETSSMQQTLALGGMPRRSVWPEERQEIKRDVQDMARNLARAQGIVPDEDGEEGQNPQAVQAEEGKKKGRFAWLKKWFRKEPPS